jgi:uncharacterized membrane protein
MLICTMSTADDGKMIKGLVLYASSIEGLRLLMLHMFTYLGIFCLTYTPISRALL